MVQVNNQIFFGLLRCAIGGGTLGEKECSCLSAEELGRLFALAKEHDVEHLLALGLTQNGFRGSERLTKSIYTAVYRAEQRERDLACVKTALSTAQIPFIPLKGAVLCYYYPEAYMRTSCDIDVLVRREDVGRASAVLVDSLGYKEGGRSAHDVSLISPEGNHIELHFDLIEEGRANNAIAMLSTAWDHAKPQNDGYCYELSDAFFYFYHVAHMAKHFEVGGCGVRPFIDLFILDQQAGAEVSERDALLQKGGLLQFANVARALSTVWFGDRAHDAVTQSLETFILHGGVYGRADNRVLIQQKKRGGKLGYLLSRMFLPYDRLLLRPDVAKMARQEIKVNRALDQEKAEEMQTLLQDLGL